MTEVPEKTGLPWRLRWRRARLGLQTLFGAAPAGYFIPYRYAAQIRPYDPAAVAYPVLAAAFDAARDAMAAHRAEIDRHRATLQHIEIDASPPAPRWAQDWFPRLDGAAGYAMVRRFEPRRLVEIGSGHSTRFYRRAVLDGGLPTRITAIDPAPRADLSGLDGVSLVRSVVQGADLALFDALGPGDFLCIDSSHILMPASDVDLLLNSILPRLPSGVVLHIHDMFLPWDYPAAWVWRGYNEQSGVAALLSGGLYEILWSSQWALRKGLVAAEGGGDWISDIAMPEGGLESSLWIRKR